MATDTTTMEGSFRQSTLGTIHKKKPLPRIPASISNKTSNLTSESNKNVNASLSYQSNIMNNNGYVSVGPAWTTSSYIAHQFMTGGTAAGNGVDIAINNNNQENMYLSESPTAITNFQQQQEQSINYEGQYLPENNFNNNQNLLLTQSHNAMDYYADPYYSHQYGGYNVQPHFFGNGYYEQQQQQQAYTSLTNEMKSTSIGNGWKTSTTSGNVPKNMVARSDSLKIESAIPVPFSKGGQLPLDTLLEKPFEPNADEQKQHHALQKKISKQEIYTFEAPSSILLMKLNQSAAAANASVRPDINMLYESGTETPSSSSDDNLSTPVSSVSSQSMNHVIEPPRLLGSQRHRHSMPLLTTRHKEESQNGSEELEVDVSFSAVEKYFQQPNNASPVSSTRIPSPWGTTSRSATMVRQNISRISTGSIPNMMSVQTVQVPDEVALPVDSTDINNKAEQYFNEEEQKKRNNKYSLSIASCSLINIRSNTKLYRRMAIKTRNKETQMTYAKYLLQISKLYEKNNHTSISLSTSKSSSSLPALSITGNISTKKQKSASGATVIESPAETRHRLLSEAGYWIEKLAKAGLPEALYIKGKWHLLGPQAEDCVMHGYEKVQEAKAFKCFLTASKAGWVEAHYELAHLWKKRKNYTKAIQCYEKGAKEKHTLSIYVSCC